MIFLVLSFWESLSWDGVINVFCNYWLAFVSKSASICSMIVHLSLVIWLTGSESPLMWKDFLRTWFLILVVMMTKRGYQKEWCSELQGKGVQFFHHNKCWHICHFFASIGSGTYFYAYYELYSKGQMSYNCWQEIKGALTNLGSCGEGYENTLNHFMH